MSTTQQVLSQEELNRLLDEALSGIPERCTGSGSKGIEKLSRDPCFDPAQNRTSSVLPTAGLVKPAPSLRSVPHRKWLYGCDLVRGEITLLCSPGGAGKSSFALGVAVSLATSRALLGQPIYGDKLRVLYINAEDSGLEMTRRLWGFCIEHEISEHELDRLRLLGVDDWQVQQLSLLRSERDRSLLHEQGIGFLDDMLRDFRPDLVVLDPLVALCAGGNMNDNAAMSLVMRAIKGLASKRSCAFLVIHHTRKGGDISSAESVSGAAATVNLSRRALMLSSMSEAEARTLAVLPSRRWSYLRLISAKSNLAPPADQTEWYELRSVTLPNAEPPIYPTGDGVQAIALAKLPASGNGLGTEGLKIERAILDLVDIGKLVGGERVPYSPSTAGAANIRGIKSDAFDAVRHVVGPQLSQADLFAVVERALRDLKAKGALAERLIGGTGRFRKGRGFFIDWSKTPWSAEKTAEPAVGPEHESAEIELQEDA